MDDARRVCVVFGFVFAVAVYGFLPRACLGRQNPVIGVSTENDGLVVKDLFFFILGYVCFSMGVFKKFLFDGVCVCSCWFGCLGGALGRK